MSKSTGSCLGVCGGVRETEAQCLVSALTYSVASGQPLHLFGHIRSPLSSAQPTCLFRPQIPRDRDGPFLCVCSVPSTKGPVLWGPEVPLSHK